MKDARQSLRSPLPQLTASDSTSSTMKALHTSLWQNVEKGLRCLACTRGCILTEGQVGFCTAIIHKETMLYSTAYGVASEISVSPIERRPVYHYRPGSRVLTIGGLGCNLRCAFCQNWEVAFRDARSGASLTQPNLSPEQAIELALAKKCQGIGWSFNEPSISPMYTLDCARLAHEAGLYTVFVTNGLMSREALRLLGPYIDVYRVDVKSLRASFYRRVAHMTEVESILPLARLAQQEYGIHVEVVTNLMPGFNDDDEHAQNLAEQILVHLGSATPWHLTTYVPYAHMTYVPPTPPETIERAYSLGRRAGLSFIYTHGMTAPERAQSFCPGCQALLIERQASHIRLQQLTADGTCQVCGRPSGIVLS